MNPSNTPSNLQKMLKTDPYSLQTSISRLRNVSLMLEVVRDRGIRQQEQECDHLKKMARDIGDTLEKTKRDLLQKKEDEKKLVEATRETVNKLNAQIAALQHQLAESKGGSNLSSVQHQPENQFNQDYANNNNNISGPSSVTSAGNAVVSSTSTSPVVDKTAGEASSTVDVSSVQHLKVKADKKLRFKFEQELNRLHDKLEEEMQKRSELSAKLHAEFQVKDQERLDAIKAIKGQLFECELEMQKKQEKLSSLELQNATLERELTLTKVFSSIMNERMNEFAALSV
jgi:chromosome segregation ATPase